MLRQDNFRHYKLRLWSSTKKWIDMGWANISGEFCFLLRRDFFNSRVTLWTFLSRYVWALCGTGLWLDVAWFSSFSYAAPCLQQELGFSDKEFGNIFSAFTGGLMAGAAGWGLLVDIMGTWEGFILGVSLSHMFALGRRLAFLGTCLVAGVFGICLGALSTYASILALVALIGLGVGGNLPVDSTSKRVTRSCIFSFPPPLIIPPS